MNRKRVIIALSKGGYRLEQIKISVIIPFYNVEEYVKECLDSVLNQAIKEIEVICIDDGSTDGTLDILKDYEKNDPRIVLKQQKNSGPSVARNLGLSLAKGEYISFVDSDDVLAPGAYETTYTLAKKTGADLVHFNGGVIFEDEEIKEQFSHRFKENSYIRTGYEEVFSKKSPLDGPTMFAAMYPTDDHRVVIWLYLYKNSFIREHQFRFVEGIYNADDEFFFKTVMSAKRVEYLEKVLYYRRVRCGSITTTKIGRNNAVSRIKGQVQMQAFLEKVSPELSEATRRNAEQYIHDRKQIIVNEFLVFLETDGSDDELIKSLGPIEQPPPQETPEKPSFAARVIRRIKRGF